MSPKLLHGDCIEEMRKLPDSSVDAIVTDPPYGLGFMGKKWDDLPPGLEFAEQALRVLKPGGHLLAFGGTRTYHRLACAIEDAGFEIRDCLAWLYGSGFPKSLDVSKAIDKAAGAERGRVPYKGGIAPGSGNYGGNGTTFDGTKVGPNPSTPEATQWQGWGTALKPAWESIVWAQKPSGEADTIRRSLWLLAEQLKSLASDVESDSSSRPAELNEAFDSAGWTADEQRNTRADLCEAMGTSQFESALTTSLNIVSSWSATLDALCELTSTFTTGTESGTTTALTTLKSSLSGLTPRSMLQAATNPDGSEWNALPAVRSFAAVESRLSATRELLAPVPATSESQDNSPEGVAPNANSIVLARKPLTGTVAANVLEHGTGAINVDGCRIGMDADDPGKQNFHQNRNNPGVYQVGEDNTYKLGLKDISTAENPAGRWPANVVLDSEAAEGLGEPARYFYCAKASRRERNAGLEGFEEREHSERSHYAGLPDKRMEREQARNPAANVHPTVKPIALMRWLVRMVTPPNGTVLDPFLGSGTTGIAAKLEGFDFIGIEREAEYLAIAQARIDHHEPEPEPAQLELAA